MLIADDEDALTGERLDPKAYERGLATLWQVPFFACFLACSGLILGAATWRPAGAGAPTTGTAAEMFAVWMVGALAMVLLWLAKPERQRKIISEELAAVVDKYGGERLTQIIPFDGEVSMEDLIAREDVVVTITRTGYAKRTKVDLYRSQKRGGRGKQATATKDDDFIDNLFVANTHDYVLCFSSLGRVYWLKVYDVPQGGRASRGRPIVNLLPRTRLEQDQALKLAREWIGPTTAHGVPGYRNVILHATRQQA